MKKSSTQTVQLDRKCWMCHGWRSLDKIDTGETSWSDATGGERGQRFPIYELKTAFASYTGELIDCPFCVEPA